MIAQVRKRQNEREIKIKRKTLDSVNRGVLFN